MSVFKKITSLLFEETVDEVMVEDQMEPIEIKEKPKAVEQKEMVYKHVEMVPAKPLLQEETTIDKPREEKKFVSIEFEKKPKRKPVGKQVETTRKHTLHASQHVEEKKEFEFSPVISPIFGSKEEENPSSVEQVVAPTLKKRRKRNPLGTVISPYYGLGELEEFEAEAQEKIVEKENMRKKSSAEEVFQSSDGQEEIDSIPLEEILGDVDVKENNKEDLMQISLFGESTPIKDSDEELNV